MTGLKPWVFLLLVAFAGGVIAGCGGEGGEPATSVPAASPKAPEPTVLGSATMAVDAVSGGTIDAASHGSAAAPVVVDIVVSSASVAYRAYQYKLEWDPAVLAYDSQVDLKPDQLLFCQPPVIVAGEVAGGCANQVATEIVGPVNTVTLRCVGSGTAALHLVTASEDPVFGSGLFSGPGQRVPTTLIDASVTCGE